jgi:acyl-CoA reductase-like NAD-dependent aldehyde dehydrogenase
MKLINPANGEVLRDLNEDNAESIAEKCRRARAAQPAWAASDYALRRSALQRFGALLAERRQHLARTLTAEVGKPITQSINELTALQARLDFFLSHTPAEIADELVLRAEAEGLEERIVHEPLGVVANVSAWNYPYFVGANVFVPALLTGNAVLYKPSEYATLTGLEITRALHDAGVPEDAFIAIVGAGAAGRELLGQRIDAVFFTGSYATGRQIAAAVAPRMVKLQLELGGKDPAYVMEDVDVGNAAAAVADGAFYNTGQSCCAVERVYVHEAIWDDFVEAFVANVRGFKVGDPSNEDTYIGPLARRELAIRDLDRQVDEARRLGATVRLEGGKIEGNGWFFAPSVLTDVDHRMSLMKDESFGPVIGLMKVKGDAQALELMNDTEYGLTAAVYGRDVERAGRVLKQLDVGSAYFNCCDRVSPRLPWSGRRHSGIGATLSTYGIETFLRPKAWHVRTPKT